MCRPGREGKPFLPPLISQLSAAPLGSRSLKPRVLARLPGKALETVFIAGKQFIMSVSAAVIAYEMLFQLLFNLGDLHQD